MKLRKNDKVEVIAGKDLGKQGLIMAVLPKQGKVIVDGVNVAKKHQRQVRQTMQAGIIDKDMPIDASNVMLVCDRCDRPVRLGYRIDDRGEKHRICRKCGKDV